MLPFARAEKDLNQPKIGSLLHFLGPGCLAKAN